MSDLIIEDGNVHFNFSAFLRKVLSSSESSPAMLNEDEKNFIQKMNRLSKYPDCSEEKNADDKES